MKQRDPLRFVLIILMLVAFFLPWISFGGVLSYRGYEIPLAASNVANLLALTGKVRLQAEWLYLLYLLPVVWCWALLALFQGRENRLMTWLSAALPFALFFAWFINHGASLFNALLVGGYLTPVAAMLLLLILLGIINPQKLFKRR